jgi:hypothetical protein
MQKRGPILLAGMLVGILPCGVATSQTAPSYSLNNQVQLGDVFSTQVLNVETVTDQTVGESHAASNQYVGSVEGQDFDARSNQTTQGSVTADTRLNVAYDSGAVTSIATTATGNAGELGVTSGTLTAVTHQNTGAVNISALSHIEAPHAYGGDVDEVSQAIGNSQVVDVNAGTAGVKMVQDNQAQVTSNGGGVYGTVTGISQFQAQTMANDITYQGDNGSGARLVTNQTNTAALTQAAQFTAFGQVQEGTTIATAAGNNVSAVNNGFLLDVANNQHNQAYVRAQAETSAAAFGAVTSSASGVGNSALLGDNGGEIVIDNVQLNEGGGIDVLASTTGGEGYDAYANATATGNSVVGYACSECGGHLTANNTQTNTSDVGASGVTTITGTARSVTGVSNAVGNKAAYYVSRPNGG